MVMVRDLERLGEGDFVRDIVMGTVFWRFVKVLSLLRIQGFSVVMEQIFYYLLLVTNRYGNRPVLNQ